jgi:hypothetical protein
MASYKKIDYDVKYRDENEIKKENLDFERDKNFYFENEQRKMSDEMVKRDSDKNIEKEISKRKPSIEIVKEIDEIKKRKLSDHHYEEI